jgi:hypothetical protein
VSPLNLPLILTLLSKHQYRWDFFASFVAFVQQYFNFTEKKLEINRIMT